MSAPSSPTRLFTCDNCRASLPYDESRAGKKCRCGRCGKVLTLPAPESLTRAAPSAPQPPERIEFYCRVCDTRMVAQGCHAGKKGKCPECGAISVIPKPAVAKAKVEPPAVHGQQYGLWGVDDAPSPAELLARQPKLFPVFCRVCDTLMYAQAKQVGAKLKCPDCGALTAVKEPPPEVKRKSALVPDGQEYRLAPSEAPTVRHVPLYIQKLQEESREQVQEKARKQAEETPDAPALPTLWGVWPMLLQSPVRNWWVGLSAGAAAVFWLALQILVNIGGGFAAVFAVCCLAILCIVGTHWFAALSSISCAILTDSSDGHRRLINAPSTYFSDWFGEAAYLLIAVAVSLVPGSFLVKATGWPLWAAGSSVLIFFPILLLSMLEQGSPMVIVSPKIFASLCWRPAFWLLFFLQSAVLAVVACLLLWMVAGSPLALFAIGSPMLVGVILLYFRILGRFAWWLAESLPTEE